jgi:hypothetical protein
VTPNEVDIKHTCVHANVGSIGREAHGADECVSMEHTDTSVVQEFSLLEDADTDATQSRSLEPLNRTWLDQSPVEACMAQLREWLSSSELPSSVDAAVDVVAVPLCPVVYSQLSTL